MPRSRKLSRFDVESQRDGFVMTIEDDRGETLEIVADRDQLELIADTLDDLLAEDDDADTVNGDSDDDED
ncbi:hypothetical protein [uncultured Alsobacter sp.]|uniref:hypothetical protein n=1 Tax=uncultured Alsobacter sp. TaxID=1748258 RepID=UPI0025EC4F72|nr:hypothetical protein [uncultured Alsobacter sp.]